MRGVGLASVIALALAAGASAEIVAPGIRDGRIAVTPNGSLVVATRTSRGRWRTMHAHRLAAGSNLVAFAAGADGPIAVVEGAESRTLVLLRRHAGAWSAVPLAIRLPAGVT